MSHSVFRKVLNWDRRSQQAQGGSIRVHAQALYWKHDVSSIRVDLARPRIRVFGRNEDDVSGDTSRPQPTQLRDTPARPPPP